MDRAFPEPIGSSYHRQERYTMGYSSSSHQWMAHRTAAAWAGFFLPHLSAGMSLLDCGCGPGSITIGLAEAVAPEQVIGIDLERGQVELARDLAAEHGAANIRFEVGNVYDLPFADASFDAAFAANLLEHLSDPLRALKEIRRVLKPNGIIGVRDPDLLSMTFEPSTPLLEEMVRLLVRSREQGDVPYARRQRRVLLEAGFARTEGFAYAECQGSPETIRVFMEFALAVARGPAFVEKVLGCGWVDRTTLEAMIADLQAWAVHPNAYRTMIHCAAIGWI